ncbi:MAG: hypothetical protein D6786_05990 [Gammaproteobacteria bacterium]|nr:MAG: hypothetical protein D6786_05990 [Gammaproteobacteria bacterium]
MRHSRTGIVIGLILLAAASRLLPHPPNFTPILAMGLFSGAMLADRRLALAVPLGAMLASDLVLGLHATVVFVYAGVAASALIGFLLQERAGGIRIVLAALAASAAFFLISNFGVWLLSGLYPRDPAGLLSCYAMAVPFFHYTLLGTLLCTALLFGSARLLRLPAPRDRLLTAE